MQYFRCMWGASAFPLLSDWSIFLIASWRNCIPFCSAVDCLQNQAIYYNYLISWQGVGGGIPIQITKLYVLLKKWIYDFICLCMSTDLSSDTQYDFVLRWKYFCSYMSAQMWVHVPEFLSEMLHWTHSSYWQCAVKPSTSAGSDLDTGADPKDIFPAKLSDSLVSSCLLIHFGTIVINLSSVPIHFVLALVLDMLCKLLFSWN